MSDLQKLEQKLLEADSVVEAGGEGAEQAKIEAQGYADQIRRLQGIEQSYTPPAEDNGGGINDMARTIAGASGVALVKGSKFLEGRDAKKINAITQAIQNVAPNPTVEGAPPPRSSVERIIQGRIDPETGNTGRQNQSYNMRTQEEALGRGANRQVINNLIKSGQITGENPLLSNPGFTGSTPSGISVKPGVEVPSPAQPSRLDMLKAKATNLYNTAKSNPLSLGVKAFTSPMVQKAMPFIGAYGVGSQGMDALQKGWEKDLVGAGISGLGAVGAYGAMRPGPQQIPGALTSLTAEGINYLRAHPELIEKFLEWRNPKSSQGY